MHKDKLQHHLENLTEKHTKLDEEIDRMEATGVFLDDQLITLKKQRLLIRDEMAVTELKISQC